MKKLSIYLCILLICSCTSYRNSNTDGYSIIGGGFKDQKISNGIYKIEVQSGISMFANTNGSKNVWHRRASELCPTGYKIYDSNAGFFHEGTAPDLVFFSPMEYGQYKGFAGGYAICKDVTIPMDEIVSIINAQEQANLDKLLSEDL